MSTDTTERTEAAAAGPGSSPTAAGGTGDLATLEPAAELPRPAPARLTEEQRQQFERDGFLPVPGALPPEVVERLLAVVDRLYEQGRREQGLSTTNHWDQRDIVSADPLFLELLDWPATFPLVVDLLGWNIHAVTAHVIVREPSPPDADAAWKALGWHRDGGRSVFDMQEPHPRLMIRIGYWLTDLSEPGRGAMRLLPGSHQRIGRPAGAEGAADPEGAIELTARPGDALLFEQRLWHAVGPNLSSITRKNLFFGYGYRWLRPQDDLTVPAELLARCDPIRRQLLGAAATPFGYYSPTPADAPLCDWQKQRLAAP